MIDDSTMNHTSVFPFLKLVADDLRRKTGNDLSRTVVVFPNKRASLFFNEYLIPQENTVANHPVWSPRYMTISELFRSLSSWSVADPIEAVCVCHKAYEELTGRPETLDFFYGWGERLLADFDDIDKNMVDPHRLFRNLAEIKELEKDEYITGEQENVLKKFFQDFSLEHNSYIRSRFLELWNQMFHIYQKLNNELAKEGLAYEGALYRKVVESIEAGDILLPEEIDRYVFVGFNVLNQVETHFFSFLQKEGKALFYWDYDNSYAGPGTYFEAGVFLRNNLERFPNELPAACFDNLCRAKDIEFVSSPTENAQARSVGTWLEEHLTKDEKKTAIILCNETLLQPVLHALPPTIQQINITKGFPLTHTPAFSLIEKELEKNASVPQLQPRHQVEILKEIGVKIHESAQQLSQEDSGTYNNRMQKELYAEAYFQAYSIVNRFIHLIESGKLQVSFTTLHRLVRQITRQASVPFHGEPAAGVQIMGVLETRNLDFENILMLSVNEGILPKKAADNSFIPYSLRAEFGMTTSRHKTAVFAYYFYRLIQRARHVRMIYNSSSEGMVKGEMSRFMTQLLIESHHHIRHVTLNSPQVIRYKMPGAIAKPGNLPQLLNRLSPSAINTYMRCQVQFFFQCVAKWKEPEPAPDIIEANTFGTIFHKAAELLYMNTDSNGRKVKADNSLTHKGKLITEQFLRQYQGQDSRNALSQLVRQAFAECKIQYNEIVASVVRTYLSQLIRHDMQLAPFEVLDTERDVFCTLDIPYQDQSITVEIKGQIDRLDKINIDGITTVRVVDYKTGGKYSKANSLEHLFEPSKNHPRYILQTFIYSMALKDSKFAVAPALFFVNQAANEKYDPYLEIGKEKILDFRKIEEDFRKGLTQLIAEIYDPALSFTPTAEQRNCKSCPYSCLCNQDIHTPQQA